MNGVRGIGLGSLTLNIGDASAFKSEVALNPGSASAPGEGGILKGGSGGPPGENPYGHCKNALAGQKGKDSDKGPSGDIATNGECGKIYVTPSVASTMQLRDVNFSCSKSPGLLHHIPEALKH